jgi:hypothetical protein
MGEGAKFDLLREGFPEVLRLVRLCVRTPG